MLSMVLVLTWQRHFQRPLVLPVSVRIPQQVDGSIPVLDELDLRKTLYDGVPPNDILTINKVAGDVLDIWCSIQAELLKLLWITLR